MNDIVPFSFEGRDIRVVMRDGEPWWVLSDVCNCIAIANSRDAADRLEGDEKDVALGDTLGGPQKMIVINESGLYRLIMRSDKPEAKRFQKWVFSEVLPSIRKTGSYTLKAKTQAELLVDVAKQLVEQERRIAAAEAVSAEAKQIAQIAEAKAQATAMACQDYSIMAWSRLHAIPIDLTTAQKLGQKAAAISRELGYPIGQARDPRFGNVNTYIETVLVDVFDDYVSGLKL